MESCIRQRNSDQQNLSNNFIQSSNIASHSRQGSNQATHQGSNQGTNHGSNQGTNQGSNRVVPRLFAASTNTSKLILKTKEKTFALSPEDNEVSAILKVRH